ncbi:MAG: type II toxin-antitoxin system RelE/ParE family toxin [Duncaniella sp.]|nr:type II toxin-antitoxin system RelE/ParE family toxin [Duncaniella sp.]
MNQSDNQNPDIRVILRTPEFDEFYGSLPQQVKEKFQYVFKVLQSVYNISTKFVKHLEGTELYEMRVSSGSDEYRSILFAIDHSNVIQSTRVILLNGFLKKSTKDYKKQINIAIKILNNLQS